MLYMIIERFRDGDDPLRMYRYVASWVTQDFGRCFQVMECEDEALLTKLTARWDDLIEFEVIPVTSEHAAATLAPPL